jgi:hypothetical protein
MISDKVKIALIKVAPTLSHIELIELVIEECQQAQRQWVGLTDDEHTALWDRAEKRQAYQGVPALLALIQEVEAKLKEKNT